MRLALALVLASIPALASASPGPTAEPPVRKSESTATLLAAGGTLGAVALAYATEAANSDGLAIATLAGVVVGPALGHVYAGAHGHALVTSGLRLAGIGAIALGVSGLEAGDIKTSTLNALLVAGGLLIAVPTAVDLMLADNAARDANARSLRLAPVVVPTASGALAPGVGLAGAF